MLKLLKHAFLKTYHSLGGVGWVLSAFLINAFLALLSYLMEGKVELLAAMLPTLAIWGVIFGGMFLWNLGAAPLFFEKEAHKVTREKLEKATQRLDEIQGTSPPRGIDPYQAVEISSVLRSIKERLGIEKIDVEHTATEEAVNFALRFSEVAHMAGLGSYPHDALWGGRDARDRGVIVRFSEGEAFEAAATEIASTLEGIGVKAIAKARGEMNAPHLSLYVARQQTSAKA